MSLPNSEYQPIPPVFFSIDTHKPFTNCRMCEKYLLEDGTSYMIEKAIKQHLSLKVKEVIFEYALCMECSSTMSSALSEESKLRIGQYFAQHADLNKRKDTLLQRKPFSLELWIDTCLIKHTPIEASSEYQIMALCNGPNIFFSYMPFAISIEALNEMTGLLSEKSLGEMDDFSGKYFLGPPEVAALLRRRLLLV